MRSKQLHDARFWHAFFLCAIQKKQCRQTKVVVRTHEESDENYYRRETSPALHRAQARPPRRL
jgi:hypothetical protein